MFNKLSNKELVSVTHDLAKTLGADAQFLDVAKLLAESATRLDVAIARGNELLRKAEEAEALMLAMRDDSRESRSKLELVVAENAALKESCKRLGEFILEEIDADYPLNMDVKTPTTDAMVNEIRAEGVELAINHLVNKFEGTGHIGVPVMALESLANQLRANAAKDGE